MKQYLKSRNQPSPESVTRAKKLSKTLTVHPLFGTPTAHNLNTRYLVSTTITYECFCHQNVDLKCFFFTFADFSFKITVCSTLLVYRVVLFLIIVIYSSVPAGSWLLVW